LSCGFHAAHYRMRIWPEHVTKESSC
jgi:hypothetical protein